MHSSIEGYDIKRVNIFIQSEQTALCGYWQWEMASSAVFCSDVMLTFPPHFEGTKGIIHPDDFYLVKDVLSQLKEAKQVNLQFRIITTYGEIKTLNGQYLSTTEPEPNEIIHPEQETFIQVLKQKELQAELSSLKQRQQVFEEAGKVAGTGVWYYNKNTQEVYYSDQIYLFHGIPPQSLNAHLNTFSSFIHPQDQEIVLQAIERAITEEIPLQLEYRIVIANGSERFAKHALSWIYNTNGERILQGTLQDYSGNKTAEVYHEQTEQLLWFMEQRLLFSESSSNSGFWQLDMVTRKFSPSENFFRIHGLKPQSTGSLSFFLNFVHPDDLPLVENYFQALRKQHTADDIEYRIIRPDGKQRNIRLQSKNLINNSGHLVLFGLIQDITQLKTLEEKLKEKTESYQLNQYGLSIGESMVHAGTWWWNQNSEEQLWSDGMYQLLGYKAQSVPLTQQRLLKLIHPEDRKIFTENLNITLREEQEATFEIKINRGGESRHLKVAFKLFHYEEKLIFIGVFQDITQERQLRQELSERIQLADLLTENLPDRVMMTDDENNILFWNKQAEKHYKQKRDQVIGKNFFEVFPQLQTEEKIKQFDEVLKGQPVHRQAIPTTQGNGVADLHMLPLIDAKKDVIGILHIIHDVTEENTLRQNLSERLHFIQSLIEASVDRIVALDRHMNYLYWNKQAEEYYDLPKEKVLGKNILEIFPAFVNDPSFGEFRKALRGETVHIPANATDTSTPGQYFETYLIPVKGQNDEVTSILWITHDLTREYQLVQQQEKSDDIINSINAAIVELDFDYRLTYINAKAEEWLQKAKKEMLGQVIWDVFPQALGTEGHRAIVTACEERQKVETEYFSTIFQKWTFISATPSIEGATVVMYDRQEINEAQLKLQESETLLRRSEEVAAIGSYETDLATMTFHFSDGMFRLFGEEPQSFTPTLEFFDARSHPDDVPAIKRTLEQAALDKQPYYYTRRIYHTSGELRVLEVHGKVLTNETGNAVKFVGLAQDITERKKAETELQKSLTLLEQSEEVAGIGSWEYDIVTGTFLWSEGMYQMFNLEPGVPVQPDIYLSLIVPEDLPKAQRIVDHLTTHPAAFEEVLQVTADGQLKTLKCKGSVIYNEEGQPLKVLGIDMDITEMVKAELEIRKSQHFLQQVTDTAPDAIMVFDVANNMAGYINPPVMEALLGYSVSELEAMGFKGRLQKIIHPDDREALLAFNERLRNAPLGEILTLEYRVQTKEGITKWLVNRGKAFVSNEPTGSKMILSVLQDITRQKESAIELQESKQFIEEVMNATLDFIMVFDFTLNRITYVNRQAYKEDEARYQETLRLSYEQILERAHPDDRETLHQFIQSFKDLPDQEIRTLDFRELRNDKVVWFRSRGKVFKRSASGEVRQYISVVQDISKEKALYEQLTERTAFAEAVVESSVDAIIVLDKNFCIKSWNRQCEQWYGIQSENALNHRLTDLFPKITEDATIMHSFQRAMQGEFMYLPAKLSEYTNRTCEYFYIPLKNEQGEVYGVLNIIHDVSRQEEYATALQDMNLLLQQQNVELEQRNEEISTFAFVASHDLKEPLRKIHTFSDWLLERETERLSSKGQDFLKRLNASVHRLNMLIDDILVLTKIHTDTRSDEDVNLNEVLRAVEEDLEELIIKTKTSIISEPLPTITSNRNQLFYLFKNLIHNAIKFHKQGSKPFVEISADVERNVKHPMAQPKQEYLKIAIHDNGIGFDEKYLRKIFKIFQQLHARGEYSGTGMGLAICRKIMENNKGFITAESTPGEGSVFYCYFPLY
mgnify:FL=1